MNIDAKFSQSCRPQQETINHAVAASENVLRHPLFGKSHSPAHVSSVDGVEPAPSQRIRLPRGHDGYVLYLDYDGVLHHENCLWHPKLGPYLSAPARYTLFQHAELLAQLLAPYPDVKIVLSTTWIRRYGVATSTKRLPEALQRRVVGGTFHSRHMREDEFQYLLRGQQVIADVQRRQPRDWLALDDDEEGWGALAHHHVLTHMYEGLSDSEVLATFKAKLEAMCKPTIK
ncbi:MAG: HAD domain-containing protein [Burkholderiaceae bacterium]|nr:HAD domain-containing protein [Burkholderiaceae bacterium]